MQYHLQWPTPAQRRCCYRLTLLYKINHNLVTVPSCQYITPNQTSTRSNSLAYLPFRCNTNAYQNSLFPKTVSQWNALPEHLVCAPSLLTSKTAVSHLLIINSPSSFFFIFAQFCWNERHFISYPLQLHLSCNCN